MRKGFLLIKIILLFFALTIHNSCLNAADLFIKAGPIFFARQNALFNASISLDFNVSKKIHLDLEFSYAPNLKRYIEYNYYLRYVAHSIFFIKFIPSGDAKSKYKSHYAVGLGIAIEGVKEYVEYINGYLLLAFTFGNEINFSKFSVLFPELRFVTYNFWFSSIWLQGGIKW